MDKTTIKLHLAVLKDLIDKSDDEWCEEKILKEIDNLIRETVHRNWKQAQQSKSAVTIMSKIIVNWKDK